MSIILPFLYILTGPAFIMSMTQRQISIIIPTFNEEETINRCMEGMLNVPDIELIVVDGGSTDRTMEIVRDYSEVRLISSLKGRGIQMNAGASSAKGEMLIFLHADCVLSKKTILKFLRNIKQYSLEGGAFKIMLLSDKFQYRLIEMGINLRSRVLKLPYGDQGLFVKKSMFEKLGGYNEMDVCEDLDFILRLKKHCKITILDDEILSSVRRWEKNGILKTFFRNQILFLFVYGKTLMRKYRYKGVKIKNG